MGMIFFNRLYRPVIYLYVFFFLLSCVSANFKSITVLDSGGKALSSLNWITLVELKQSLPKGSIAVGFDVDDTVLFSSPGFMYRENNIDGVNGQNKYGNTLKQQRSSKIFWEDMNFKFDQFSMPKKIAYKLINMHKNRGDKIYFITARPPSKQERLSLVLSKHFKLNPKKMLYFSNRKTKSPFIKKLNIKLFYGDSDSDITSAKQAGIRAIRILRSPLSTYKRKFSLGKFQEEILKDSAL